MLRWGFKMDMYSHVHLETKQGKTDFQSQFMARHMNSLQATVLEMRQGASLTSKGMLNLSSRTCTLGADPCMASKTLLPGLFLQNPLSIGNILKRQVKFLQSCLYLQRGSWAAPGSTALPVQPLSLQHRVPGSKHSCPTTGTA